MKLSNTAVFRSFGSIACAAVLLLPFLSSCTIDAPEILNTVVSYEYIADPADDTTAGEDRFPREQLSFTLTVNEPQGEKDLQKAVVDGPESLVWDIPFSEMHAEEAGGYLKLMLPALVPPPGEALLPEGTYRIQLHDLSGEIGTSAYSHVDISRAAVSVQDQDQQSGPAFTDRFPRLLPHEADALSEISSEEKSQHIYIEAAGFPLYIRAAASSGRITGVYAVPEQFYPVTHLGERRFILHVPRQMWEQLADDHPKADGVYLSLKDPVTGNFYTRGIFTFSNLLGAANR